MATTALSLPYAVPGSLGRTLRLYLREIRFELLRAARNKPFALSTIGFPTMFYLLFGVLNRGEAMRGGVSVAKYLLASYAAFGMVGAALFGIGVGLALERTSGWLELKRASPMPPFAYLVARRRAGAGRQQDRVVILTTFARAGYLRRALDAGARGYLLKDRPVSELAEAVRRVHSGLRFIDPDLAAEAWNAEADPLSDRERQILQRAGDGRSSAEIAGELRLSEGTVRNYLSEAIAKLGAANRTDAARIARARGWL